MAKTRLDLLLVERKLAESRSKAQALIMAGQVRVGGQVVGKPATPVAGDADVEVEYGPRYVSRGGEKLEAALVAFGVDVTGWKCADVGSSTGGFSDCLLQHGAAKVYAIDVGKGILHWKLRNDPRVVVMEETNARHIGKLPEPVELVTIDTSFISLKVLLPVVKGWLPSPPTPLAPAGRMEGSEGIIALIKPQFEAGRQESARHKGVIRDPQVHRRVLREVLSFAEEEGFSVRGLIKSPVLGPKGNVEFLGWLMVGGQSVDLREMVERVLKPKE